MSFELDLKPLVKALDGVGSRVGDSLAAALYAEANNVIIEAKRLVPVDTGVLKGSGTVLDPEIGSGSVSVEFGFGGAASAYAAVQHEDLTLQHKDGKSAKYLEIPLLAASAGMGARIEERMRRGVRAAASAEE